MPSRSTTRAKYSGVRVPSLPEVSTTPFEDVNTGMESVQVHTMAGGSHKSDQPQVAVEQRPQGASVAERDGGWLPRTRRPPTLTRATRQRRRRQGHSFEDDPASGPPVAKCPKRDQASNSPASILATSR